MGLESPRNIEQQLAKLSAGRTRRSSSGGYQSYADFRDSGLSFVRLRFL
jgi:hypothetical protein